MFHYRKNHIRKFSFPKPAGCPFCEHILLDHVIEQTEHHIIVKNHFMYDVWELRRVTDHLLVLPKRHVLSLNELTDTERLDHMNLLAKYEVLSYNIYARGIGSKQRTVDHQHTHLIQTRTKQFNGSLSIRKPYIFKTF